MTPPAAACRSCGAPLATTFVNLGMSPLCESFVPASRLHEMEPFYPLQVFVCDRCLLVQLLAYVPGEEIFSEYAYFSSYSDAFLAHAQGYVAMAIERFGLTPAHRVVEVASNDGYLLQYVVQAGIPALGIEPAANVARDAEARGVPTRVKFFGRETARALAAEGLRADLMVANNVIAHVPDLNDFVGGFAILLAPGGAWTIEIPHLLRLVEGTQYDTIYHEHYTYFSFHAMEDVLRRHRLEVFDVEEIWTHGGSLRYFVRHAGEDGRGGRLAVTPRVAEMRERERAAGVTS
ncbi:MAG: methyltransferase domain-containing protein, partial [Gemmatimonadales bacterium]